MCAWVFIPRNFERHVQNIASGVHKKQALPRGMTRTIYIEPSFNTKNKNENNNIFFVQSNEIQNSTSHKDTKQKRLFFIHFVGKMHVWASF